MQRTPHLESELSTVLRFGVVLAAIVVALGGAIYLARHAFDVPNYASFHTEVADLRSVAGIFRGLATFTGRGLIQFGLLLLIATPIIRVALAGFVFLRNKDWLYVTVACIVLALLLFGLVTGK